MTPFKQQARRPVTWLSRRSAAAACAALTFIAGTAIASTVRAQAAAPTLSQPGAVSDDYSQPGAFKADLVDQIWRDTVRGRAVPVRLRLPQGPGPFALVIFSHGLGGSRQGGQQWGEHWASHGLAVLHVQHPGSDESIWRDKPVGERMAGLRGGMSAEQFLARIEDVRFVLDELARRRAGGQAQMLSLDLNRAGMSGHSFGASTTLHLAGKKFPAAAQQMADARWGPLADSRLRAFIAFSPQASGDDLAVQFGQVGAPCLLLTGTRDGQPFPGIGALPEQRLLPFEAMAPAGNKYLTVFDDADHMLFNGVPGRHDFTAPGRAGSAAAAIEARVSPAVKAGTTAFWLAYLQQDTKAAGWLRDGAYAASIKGIGRFAAK